eukprot:450016-Pelagomonas_calceolata.AAC.5
MSARTADRPDSIWASECDGVHEIIHMWGAFVHSMAMTRIHRCAREEEKIAAAACVTDRAAWQQCFEENAGYTASRSPTDARSFHDQGV